MLLSPIGGEALFSTRYIYLALRDISVLTGSISMKFGTCV